MMYLAPHPPFDIPEPFYSMFAQETMDPIPDNVGMWYPYQSPLQLYNLPGVIGGSYTMQQWKEAWRVYRGLVALLDQCVGRVIEQLKEQGLYEDSILVFTSDHGEMLGSHRLFQKMCMYEESVHVPLSIKLPQQEYGGSKWNEAVSHMDVMPTLTQLLNLPMKHEMEGTSLLPIMKGEIRELQKPIYIQFDGNGARGNFQRCIIKDGYKLIMDIFKDETYFELYHLASDVQETRNLLFRDGYEKISNQLLEQLLHHMEVTNDLVTPSNTNLELFVNTYQEYDAKGARMADRS